jgi:hypothetical protein
MNIALIVFRNPLLNFVGPIKITFSIQFRTNAMFFIGTMVVISNIDFSWKRKLSFQQKKVMVLVHIFTVTTPYTTVFVEIRHENWSYFVVAQITVTRTVYKHRIRSYVCCIFIEHSCKTPAWFTVEYVAYKRPLYHRLRPNSNYWTCQVYIASCFVCWCLEIDRTRTQLKLAWYKADDKDFHLIKIDRLVLTRSIASKASISQKWILVRINSVLENN